MAYVGLGTTNLSQLLSDAGSCRMSRVPFSLGEDGVSMEATKCAPGTTDKAIPLHQDALIRRRSHLVSVLLPTSDFKIGSRYWEPSFKWETMLIALPVLVPLLLAAFEHGFPAATYPIELEDGLVYKEILGGSRPQKIVARAKVLPVAELVSMG